MKRVNGKFERISWDQVLTEMASKLLLLRGEFGPSTLGVFSGSIGAENSGDGESDPALQGSLRPPRFFSVESACYRMYITTGEARRGC